MDEPTITCPHCKAGISLTESLAVPLIRATRKNVAEKEAELARRESAICAQRAELAKAVESAEQQLTTRLKTERERMAAEEAAKAQLLATDLESRSQEVATLQRELRERDSKLAKVQRTQVGLIPKQPELEDAKHPTDLQIETRFQESLSDIRCKAKQEARDSLELEISEKEEQIACLQRRMDEMELVYQYLTGPRFRQRIEAIVGRFSSMQTDLERERKAMTRLRAKREGQVRGAIESTVGMCDDVQGIAGKALEGIDGLAQMARRVEARRKRGVTTHRVTEPNGGRGRTQ